MQSHIIHAHPNPASFNAALTAQARQTLENEGATVTISDLYQSEFDPVERGQHYPCRLDPTAFSALAEQRHAWRTDRIPDDVEREIHALEAADLVILQFPLWWHGAPAILKGWFDRVFLSGGLYTSRMRYDAGYFRGRRALLSVTSGAPQAAFGPGARGGDPEVMLWPLQYSLHYLGFEVLPPFWSFGVQGHGYSYEDSDKAKARLRDRLDAWATHLKSLDAATPLAFPGWANWDGDGRALAPPTGDPSHP